MDPSVFRILDANCNRTCEGLRVLEEYVRLGLDDRRLTTRLKALRHHVTTLVSNLTPASLIRARAIESDVGCDVGLETERRRTGLAGVCAAAAKRSAEALRVLEECAKLVDEDCARQLELSRYELYEIERALAIRRMATRRFEEIRLYVIVTESICRHPWADTLRRVISGGADCIQLREPDLCDRELLPRARRLVEACRESEVVCIINDRPDIARLAGADGVHVGQDDLRVNETRRIVGPEMCVGVSTHSVEQARVAADTSPDYIAVGPMFPTATKPQMQLPGLELIRRIKLETSLPVIAIGGLDCEKVADAIAAGADTVCVCSSVIAQEDVEGATRSMKERITESVTAFAKESTLGAE